MRSGFPLILLLICALPAPALAGSTSAFDQLVAKSPVYAKLSSDLETEVLDFDEFRTPGAREQARRFAQEWRDFIADPLHSPDPIESDPLEGIPKVSGLPESPASGPAPATPGSLEKIAADPAVGTEPPSMQDITTYVNNRLGAQAASLIHEGAVQAVVYAGTEKNALLQFSGAIRIPSVYEKWGVSKFFLPSFVSGASGAASAADRGALIYVIPPLREYAEHYGDLVELAGGKPEILMNSADRQAELDDLSRVSASVVEKLGGAPDYIVLGYSKAWSSLLGQAARKSSVETEGITGTLYEAEIGGLKTRVITFSSSRTLWGEASSALVRGTLPSNPRAVLFMGSSGGISDHVSLYGTGVPAEFRDRAGRKIAITNLFYKPGNGPAIVHGNVASPAAETIPQVDQWLSQGVDSVDVEQSLVANEIASYDKTSGAGIRFGAADLITDLPASTSLGRRALNDLDNVDAAQKAKTQGNIVDFALNSIRADRKAWPVSYCERLLLPARSGGKP